MKFGLCASNFGAGAEPTYATWLAQTAEALGFESLWTSEHIVVPLENDSVYPFSTDGRMDNADDTDRPEPLVWLAYVAATTSTIHLATGILVLPQRNPVILAKELASLDRLSGGRLTLGIGVGWLREEFELLGIPFRERGARTDEFVQVLRALWGAQPCEFHGTFIDVPPVYCCPTPSRPSGIPIVVSGHSEAAARRAGRLGDGFYPHGLEPPMLEARINLARRMAEDSGRDPAALEITVLDGHDEAAVERAWALGIDRYLINPLTFASAEVEEALDTFSSTVISAYGNGQLVT